MFADSWWLASRRCGIPASTMQRLLASLIFIFLACSCPAFAANAASHSVAAAGLTRSYSIHVPGSLPAGKAVPLVFVFHGSGGNGAGMEAFSGFGPVADREGFILVY